MISRGEKAAEKDVLNLTELLMTQLIKLDGIMAEGDVKLQRRMQVQIFWTCLDVPQIAIILDFLAKLIWDYSNFSVSVSVFVFFFFLFFPETLAGTISHINFNFEWKIL